MFADSVSSEYVLSHLFVTTTYERLKRYNFSEELFMKYCYKFLKYYNK